MVRESDGRKLAMLCDRHKPMDLFTLVPKLDLEMDPILTELDRLLDDDVVFPTVKADLARRYPPDAHARSAFHAGRGDPADDRRQAVVSLERRRDRALCRR